MKSVSRLVSLTIIGLFIFVSCGVPKEKYNTAVKRADDAEARAGKAEADLKTAQGSLTMKDGEVKELKQKMTMLERINSDLKKAAHTKVDTNIASTRPANSFFPLSAEVVKENKKRCFKVNSSVSLTAAFITDESQHIVKGAPKGMAKHEAMLRPSVKAAVKSAADCFMRGKARKGQEVASHFGISFMVDKKGRVRNARVSHPFKVAGKADRCVMTALKKMKLAPAAPLYATYWVHAKTTKVITSDNCKKKVKQIKKGKRGKKGKRVHKRGKRGKKGKKAKKAKK